MTEITPRLLTDEQAAAYLSMPVATVVREGIGRVRFGRHTRYDRAAIDAWLDERAGLTPRIAETPDSAEAAFDRFVQSQSQRAA